MMPMKKNIIIRGIGGFYDVLTFDNKIIRCRLRGKLRLTESRILVGDWVVISYINDKEGVIEEILPRKNQLIRPAIANIDQAVIVLSFTAPKPDLLLLDRLLVLINAAELEPVICINKSDLCNEGLDLADNIRVYQDIGYRLVITSTVDNTGIKELKELLNEKVSTFVGPSGVGKSSLLNSIVSGLKLPIGAISTKLQRGKHTTRQVELISLPCGGLVADTPGFSQLSLTGLAMEDLQKYFPEIWSTAHNCKFRGCLHHKEPECAVMKEVSLGNVSKHRYENYLALMAELKV